MIIKNSNISHFLNNPPSSSKIFFFYGPNQGLSYERANTLAHSLANSVNLSSLISRLEGDSLSDAPDYLSSLASSNDFFNEIKVAFIRLGSRNLLPLVQNYVSSDKSDLPVIILAGDVARSHSLRAFAETDTHSAAIASYPDEKSDISNILRHSLESNDIKLRPDAFAYIIENMSDDRLILRSEIDKIITYSKSNKETSIAEIQELLGNTSSVIIQSLIDNAFCGNKKEVEHIYSQLQSSKEDQSVLCSLILFHALQLLNLLNQIKSNSQIPNLVMQTKSIHFSRRSYIEIHLKKWNSNNIIKLIEYTNIQILEIRKKAHFKNDIANRLLIKISAMSS